MENYSKIVVHIYLSGEKNLVSYYIQWVLALPHACVLLGSLTRKLGTAHLRFAAKCTLYIIASRRE